MMGSVSSKFDDAVACSRITRPTASSSLLATSAAASTSGATEDLQLFDMVFETDVLALSFNNGSVGEFDDGGCNALMTLSIESGEDGSLESRSLSKSSVSGLKISKDISFGTTTFELDDEMRRTMGKLESFLNFGMGGRSLICCRVILGVRCFDCIGGLLTIFTGAGVGGVTIVLILVCIPLPFIRKVVDTFFVVSNFDFTIVVSDFSTHSKENRVVSFADI